VFQKPKHPVQRFTSKVAGFHPQLPGWFCPQIDKANFTLLVYTAFPFSWQEGILTITEGVGFFPRMDANKRE